MNHGFIAWLVMVGFMSGGVWLVSDDASAPISALVGAAVLTALHALFEIADRLVDIQQTLKERRD